MIGTVATLIFWLWMPDRDWKRLICYVLLNAAILTIIRFDAIYNAAWVGDYPLPTWPQIYGLHLALVTGIAALALGIRWIVGQFLPKRD